VTQNEPGRLVARGGSDAANPRLSAAPIPIRLGSRDNETAHGEHGGIRGESPAAATTLAHEHMHGPFRVLLRF
jgi:hypothetical protein